MRTEAIREEIAELRAKATHARELGAMVGDRRTQRNLAEYADGLEREAAELEKQAEATVPESDSERDEPA